MFIVVNVVSGANGEGGGDIYLNTAEIVRVEQRDEGAGEARIFLRDGSALDVANRWEDFGAVLDGWSGRGSDWTASDVGRGLIFMAAWLQETDQDGALELLRAIVVFVPGSDVAIEIGAILDGKFTIEPE